MRFEILEVQVAAYLEFFEQFEHDVGGVDLIHFGQNKQLVF